ncbi:hypothetical protein P7H00_00390 [Enterococcus pseudoavium]|uniref:Uncharacterized protein n=1 Tax=Enterococcus pseudoavium TaxID=44007 RepID=A0AAE4L2C5_9ENTE|nr:hypothetical protein [Enterococcus pseudoavium]MDT2735589.1 hypothetical protein [Enterococcus pseudoavium]
MKKVLWIYSLNVADGGGPIGYAVNTVGILTKERQAKLQGELGPAISLQFISYDITSKAVPAADLIIFNDRDAIYLSEAVKKNGLAISYRDLLIGNEEKIIQMIKAFFELPKN